jgi:hypothetical protein
MVMDRTIDIHKQTVSGRLAGLQRRAAACKAWLARLAREQAFEAARTASRRPLAPR